MKDRSVSTVIFSANALLREGLIKILTSVDFNIIHSKSLHDDIASDLSLPHSDILLIVDASDDFDSAITQIKPFKLKCQNSKVAVLVGRHQLQITQMISAFRSGASAYLMNFTTPEAFIKSLQLVMFGETIVPLTMLAYLLDNTGVRSDCKTTDQPANHVIKNDNGDDQQSPGYSENNDAVAFVSQGEDDNGSPNLSTRQTAVLRCLVEGDSNKVIARKMKIADATVKVHIKTILRKIRVDNRTQAAIWAIRNNAIIMESRNAFSNPVNFRIGDTTALRDSISP
jgi:two-component system nitrate/nitrite response regulator NarL